MNCRCNRIAAQRCHVYSLFLFVLYHPPRNCCSIDDRWFSKIIKGTCQHREQTRDLSFCYWRWWPHDDNSLRLFALGDRMLSAVAFFFVAKKGSWKRRRKLSQRTDALVHLCTDGTLHLVQRFLLFVRACPFSANINKKKIWQQDEWSTHYSFELWSQ